MRTPKLAGLLTALALTGVAPLVASAETTDQVTTTVATETTKAPATDAQRYAAREAKSQQQADFKGGAEGVVVIGTSTIVLAVLIALIVIML